MKVNPELPLGLYLMDHNGESMHRLCGDCAQKKDENKPKGAVFYELGEFRMVRDGTLSWDRHGFPRTCETCGREAEIVVNDTGCI